MDPEEDLSYIALCPTCNGWRGISVISPERTKDNARHVARWIRAGLKIETWTVARIRAEARMCQCFKNREQKLPL